MLHMEYLKLVLQKHMSCIYRGFIWRRFVGLADHLYVILIFFIAVSIFLLFASVDYSSELINIIASTTFGIYLLHDSGLGRILIWDVIVCPDLNHFSQAWYKYMICLILTVITIFVICGIIDLVRQIISKKLIDKRVDMFLLWLKEKGWDK